MAASTGARRGFLTLEDLVDEIVGAIENEYDLADDTQTWLDEHTIVVAVPVIGPAGADLYRRTTPSHENLTRVEGPRQTVPMSSEALVPGLAT